MSLLSRFVAYDAKPALIGVWGECAYVRLAALVDEAARALAGLRLPGPAAVAVVGDHGPAATAWLLALASAGHFAVPLAGNPAEHADKPESQRQPECARGLGQRAGGQSTHSQ